MSSFMIFGNALAFLIKPNTITENRKQKQLKKRETEELPGAYLPPKWPAQPTSAPLVIFLLCQKDWARGRPARARSPPAPACRFPWTTLESPRSPRPLSHSPSDSFPFSALSPPRTQMRQRAPPCTAAATATPSPLRRAHELRAIVLVTSTEPSKPGSTAVTPSSSSTPTGARDRRRQSVASDASPSTLTFSTASL